MSVCFVFDLDGTLTQQELLPVVADTLDLRKEIEILTDLTIKGVISFHESFRLRYAILRSAPIEVVQQAIAKVDLDENLLSFIRANVERCFVITGNLDIWIRPIVNRIGCKIFSSVSASNESGKKDLDYIMHKADKVLELRDRFERIIAIGEGANDIPMFEAADIGIAYGGVHSPAEGLLEISNYVTYESEPLCRLLNTLL